MEKGDKALAVEVAPDMLKDYLGVPKHRYGEKEEKPMVGLVNGLAYTEMGRNNFV